MYATNMVSYTFKVNFLEIFGMTTYKAPLADMKFLLNNVLEMPSIAKLSGYEDATPDMVDAILNEADRFYSEVLAPTNLPADSQGSRLDGGNVITAPALEGVYKKIVDAGWSGLSGSTDFGARPAYTTVCCC